MEIHSAALNSSILRPTQGLRVGGIACWFAQGLLYALEQGVWPRARTVAALGFWGQEGRRVTSAH